MNNMLLFHKANYTSFFLFCQEIKQKIFLLSVLLCLVKVNATPKKILIAFNLTNRRVAFK